MYLNSSSQRLLNLHPKSIEQAKGFAPFFNPSRLTTNVVKNIIMPNTCLWTHHPKDFKPSSQAYWIKLLNPSSSWALWTLYPKDFKPSSQVYWIKLINPSSSGSLWTLHPKDFKHSYQVYYWMKFLNPFSSWSLWTLHPKDFTPSSQVYWTKLLNPS